MDLRAAVLPLPALYMLWARRPTCWTTGRDRLPPVRPDPSRVSPLMSGRGLFLLRRGNPQVTLVPFAGFNLIRFHGSRINGLSFASFDGQHSDKMAPV